jgi:sigma-B regulation protein RsbU (phosphoserine phosphatase)
MGASQTMDQCLAEFNETLFCCTAPDRYSTLFWGVFDSASGILHYVNCGHVAPILCHAAGGKGGLERLDVGGTPIGLLAEASFEQAEVRLAPGDLLVCVSDGFTEAANSAEEMWGESALVKAVREEVALGNRGTDARQIVSHLFAAVDEFAGGEEQSDDMTVVVLRSL